MAKKTTNNHLPDKKLIKSLEGIERTFQQQVIIELYKVGITQPNIARNLGIGAGVVNKLLKGVKRQNKYDKETQSQNSSKAQNKNR